jgi:hypothetical protein
MPEGGVGLEQDNQDLTAASFALEFDGVSNHGRIRWLWNRRSRLNDEPDRPPFWMQGLSTTRPDAVMGTAKRTAYRWLRNGG